MTRARVTIPATTCNLGPGLDCMALALELYNIVELTEVEHGLYVDVEGDFAPGEMASGAMLTQRAIQCVFHKAGYLPSGLRVHLENHIPPGDSLGGNIACLLGGAVAANVLLGGPFTREELLGLVLGIDNRPHIVLAAQLGGLVICAGREDDFSFAPVCITPTTVVAVLPPKSAAEASPVARPQQVSRADAIANIGNAALVAQALSTGRFDLLRRAMKDRLHESACSKTIPGYQEMVDAALGCGAAAVTISGSGPALIAFAEKEHSEVAQAMMRAHHTATGADMPTWVVPVDTQGVSITQMGMTTVDKPVPASEKPVVFYRPNSQPSSSSAEVARTAAIPAHLTFAPGFEGQNP